MLSDEEKEAIERLTKKMEYYKNKPLDTHVWLTLDEHYVRILLNLIKKQSKEIEELKEKCKEVVYIPEGTCFMLEPKDVDKKWKDKIKAKIEPVLKQLERKMQEEYNKYGNSREYQDIVDAYNFLQSLLEKE